MMRMENIIITIITQRLHNIIAVTVIAGLTVLVATRVLIAIGDTMILKNLILIMVVVLLVDCGSMQEKADELRNIAMVCNEREKIAGENCDREWAAWNEAEERAVNAEKRRAEKKRPKCPQGKVAYCDPWCMKDKPAKRTWICVRQGSIHIY